MGNPYEPIPFVDEDQDISASKTNNLIRLCNRNRVIPGPGLYYEFTDGGLVLDNIASVIFWGALTPGGGIAGATGTPPTPGSATCNIYGLNGAAAWTDTGTTETVLFDVPSTTAIGGNKYILVYRGSDGYLHAFVEGCP